MFQTTYCSLKKCSFLTPGPIVAVAQLSSQTAATPRCLSRCSRRQGKHPGRWGSWRIARDGPPGVSYQCHYNVISVRSKFSEYHVISDIYIYTHIYIYICIFQFGPLLEVLPGQYTYSRYLYTYIIIYIYTRVFLYVTVHVCFNIVLLGYRF